MAASSTLFLKAAGVVFTIVIELGMPHITAGWQDELAGVVYGEARWQTRGVIFGVDGRHGRSLPSVKGNLVIFVVNRGL